MPLGLAGETEVYRIWKSGLGSSARCPEELKSSSTSRLLVPRGCEVSRVLLTFVTNTYIAQPSYLVRQSPSSDEAFQGVRHASNEFIRGVLFCTTSKSCHAGVL